MDLHKSVYWKKLLVNCITKKKGHKAVLPFDVVHLKNQSMS
jgi:hypothetical protein